MGALRGEGFRRATEWIDKSDTSSSVEWTEEVVYETPRGRRQVKFQVAREAGRIRQIEIPRRATRSFVVAGQLDQLRGPSGVHTAKYRSLELYRRNLYEPEIVTFDRYCSRARSGTSRWRKATTQPASDRDSSAREGTFGRDPSRARSDRSTASAFRVKGGARDRCAQTPALDEWRSSRGAIEASSGAPFRYNPTAQAFRLEAAPLATAL